jgi:methyl-accepting chemotaxis protein
MPFHFKNLSIPCKINAVILTTCATTLGVTAAAMLFTELATVRHSFSNDMQATGQMLGQTLTASVAFDNRASAHDLLTAVQAKPHILRAALELPDGSPFAAYTNANVPALPAMPKTDGLHFEGPFLALTEPVFLKGERIATLHLLCGYQTEFYRSLRHDGLILASVLLASIFLALILSHRLQSIISAPILSLTDTAREVAEKKDYSLRAKAQNQDEVGELTLAFNQMLERIHAQDQALNLSQAKMEALIHSVDGIVWECSAVDLRFNFHEPPM